MHIHLHSDPIIREWLEAAERGDLARLTERLDRGIDINTTSKGGTTALMLAAYAGHVEAVRWLLDRGADLHAVGRDGLTPLAWAIREGRDEVAAILRAAGATE